MIAFVNWENANCTWSTGNTNCIKLEAKSTSYELSASEKAKIDLIFNTFLAKIQKKWTNATLKTLDLLIKTIDTTISKLESGNSKNKDKGIAMLTYLKSLASKWFEIWETTISEITKQTWYIQKIYTKDWVEYMDFETIWRYTWDNAAKQLEINEPKTCEAMKKEDNTDKCYALNDYYVIRTWKITTFKISNEVKVIMQTYSSNDWEMKRNEVVSYENLKEVITNWNKNNNMKYDTVPFHIELSNNIVTKITEQFIP